MEKVVSMENNHKLWLNNYLLIKLIKIELLKYHRSTQNIFIERPHAPSPKEERRKQEEKEESVEKMLEERVITHPTPHQMGLEIKSFKKRGRIKNMMDVSSIQSEIFHYKSLIEEEAPETNLC